MKRDRLMIVTFYRYISKDKNLKNGKRQEK